MGYTNVTTGSVIQQANISRGTMLHHFPSKVALVKAAVELLHERLLNDYTNRVNQIPDTLIEADRRRAGLEAYWAHLSGPLSQAYHELCIAGLRELELQDILEESIKLFEKHIHEKNMQLFEEWLGRGQTYYLAMDITQFLMQGMAFGQIKENREQRVRQMIDYLSNRLEEIFEESGSTAATRHTDKLKGSSLLS